MRSTDAEFMEEKFEQISLISRLGSIREEEIASKAASNRRLDPYVTSTAFTHKRITARPTFASTITPATLLTSATATKRQLAMPG
jgi:hypothetical protein